MFNNPMYYNNPYTFYNPNMNNIARGGIFSSLFKVHNINWSNLLNNTQKTLNVINQAIPVYYQIKPICTNAKTMLKMVNALKDDDTSSNKSSSIDTKKEEKNTSYGPVFFT